MVQILRTGLLKIMYSSPVLKKGNEMCSVIDVECSVALGIQFCL